MSVSAFGALGVPDDLCARLTAAGIVDPFPIQSAVIADALAGRDVTGRAPTGSGKTLAFGIPVVANLERGTRRRPTALVLAPTRELAEQIANELRPLAKARRHSVVSVYGGVGYGPQRKGLDAGASLVVGCPGRLEDLLSMGALRLDDVKQVVIDEADRLADMGFMPAVRRILEQVHPDRQVLMFSATLDGAVGKLAESVQRDPVRHEVGPAGPDMNNARHAYWTVDRAQRSDVTADIVRQFGSTMVFCRTRHGADRVAKRLSQLGVSAAPIHGGLSQPKRDKALKSFVDGNVDALVATDVAARGVHVDDVAAVVHFDPPADSATYVHRSGRTARAGASGVVIALVERGEEKSARRLQREVGIDVGVTKPSFESLKPSQPMTNDSRPAATASTDRRTGTVKFFHDGRGYGFIDVGAETDVFVHYTNTRSTLTNGLRVELGVRQGQKGLEAFDVVAVG